MRITVIVTSASPASVTQRLNSDAGYVVLCWARMTLAAAAVVAAEPVEDDRVSLTFELVDTHPAEDPLSPDDLVFSPPLGIGDFSYVEPPSPDGRQARLRPGAYISRIEQRSFEEQKVSLTRAAPPVVYNDETMRALVVHQWTLDLRRDMDAADLVPLAGITSTWFTVPARHDAEHDAATEWVPIADGSTLTDAERAICELTTLAAAPTDDLVITYDTPAVARR